MAAAAGNPLLALTLADARGLDAGDAVAFAGLVHATGAADLLATVAAFGTPVGCAELGAVTGQPAELIELQLQRAAAMGVVRFTAPDPAGIRRVEIAHDLHAQAALADADRARRAHRAVALHVIAEAELDDDDERFVDGARRLLGIGALTPSIAARAAAWCCDNGALEDARDLALAGSATGLEGSTSDHSRLQRTLALAWTGLEDHGRAAAHMGEALALARSCGDADEFAWSVVSAADVHGQTTSDTHLALVDEALARLDEMTPRTAITLRVHASHSLMNAGDHARAGALSTEAEALARELGDVDALIGVLALLVRTLRPADWDRLPQIAVELGRLGHGHPRARTVAAAARLEHAFMTGTRSAVEDSLVELERSLRHVFWPRFEAVALIGRMSLASLTGDRDALAEVTEAPAWRCARPGSPPALQFLAGANLWRLNMGDFPFDLGHLGTRGDRIDSELTRCMERSALSVLGEIDPSRVPELRAMLRSAPDPDDLELTDAMFLMYLTELAFSAAVAGDADVAARAAARLDPFLDRMTLYPVSHISGPVAFFVAEGRRVGGDPEGALDAANSAIAVSLRLGAESWRSRSLISRGRAASASGDDGDARLCFHEALGIANELGFETVALVARRELAAAHTGDATPTPVLTPRQLAVLRQVAEGMTNEGVARTLGVSVKTVEFHLDQAYRRLRASNRTQAVANAREFGLI